MRRNLLLFGLLVIVLSVAYFFLVWRPQSTRITAAELQANETEQQVEQVKLEIARLKALRDRAPELRQQAAKLDTALPGEPQLAQFILQVQEAANTSGIDWLSISPTPPAAEGGGQGGAQSVLAVNISMQVTGGYFQVQDFIVRLESLSRAVKIGTISLSPGGGQQASGLSSSLGMKMFVAPPAPAPAPSPTAAPAG